MIQLKRGVLTPEMVNTLSSAVGWGKLNVEQLEIALSHSVYTLSVVDNNKIVGMGRMTGDISMSYFIKDVIVHPEYQGKGIGQSIIKDMLSFIKETTKREWNVQIELVSASGKEAFYEKLGFEKRLPSTGDCGMSLRINNI